MTFKKPKILYFTDCFIFGGCEYVLANLINNKKINEQFKIIYSYRYSHLYQDAVNKKFGPEVQKKPLFLLDFSTSLYRLGLSQNRKLIKKSISLIILIIKKTKLLSLVNFVQIFILLRRIKPDILHINNGGYPAAENCRIAVFSARFAGIKRIVFGVHNLALKQKTKLEKYKDSFINKNVSYFITASKTARLKLIENRKFDKNHVLQIHNAITHPEVIINKPILLKEFNIENNKFIIVEVALLTKRKGQIHLLNAIKKIRDVDEEIFNNIFVFFIGEGEDRFKLESYVKKHNLEKNINFMGYRSDYMDFINAADIFVLPSIQYEDMPLVILSAMSLKKTIISTQLAGIMEEIRHNQEGILLKPNELDKLSESIIRLYKDAEFCKKLGINAYQRYIKFFDSKRIISEYIKVYKRLIEEKDF